MRTALTTRFEIEHPIVGFNRSPAVVVEVSRAGDLGVLGATAYGPDELDAQLSRLEEHLQGRPHGVDLLCRRVRPAEIPPIWLRAFVRRSPTNTGAL